MKLRFLFISIATLLFVFSCKDDDDNLDGTGVVSFFLDELVEIENATIGLAINIGIDEYNHSGGTIDVSITGANYGTAFETSSGSSEFTLEVSPQTLTASFSIMPIDDELIGPDKVLTISLTNATGALELGDETTLTFTILDNDDPLIALVAFENATSQIQEDDSNATSIIIPFDQATTEGGTLTVSSSGDAVFGTDYSILGETSENFIISVPAGATSASFDIQPIDNSDFEADKSVTFSIDEVSGGLSLGVQTETIVSIVNDDVPPNPVVDFSAVNALTYNEDTGTVTLNLDLTGQTSADAIVEITTSGSADASDFNFSGSTSNPYTFTIPSGATTGSLDITIIDDSDLESDETIILNITSVTGGLDAGVNIQSQTITITDNDTASFSYVETFETASDIESVGYEVILVDQDLPDNRVLKYNNNANKYADVNDVTLDSDTGIQIFYNITNDGEGLIDNMAISPLMNTTGNISASIDVAYVTGPTNGNNAVVTFYWSDTYTGSGNFVDSEWSILDSETAADMNGEGISSGDFKRKEFNFSTSDSFYIAVRITQTMTATQDKTQWRFDNFKVNN